MSKEAHAGESNTMSPGFAISLVCLIISFIVVPPSLILTIVLCFRTSALILAASVPIKTRPLTDFSFAIILANALKSEFFDDPPSINTLGSGKEWIAAIVVSGVVEKESL